jgi:hypothetical protein
MKHQQIKALKDLIPLCHLYHHHLAIHSEEANRWALIADAVEQALRELEAWEQSITYAIDILKANPKARSWLQPPQAVGEEPKEAREQGGG